MINLHVETEAFRQEMEQVRHTLEMWLERNRCSIMVGANAAKCGMVKRTCAATGCGRREG